jgi:hypothetical protein
VVRPRDIGFLHQEMPFDPASTIAAVLDDALREVRKDLAELDRLTRALADTSHDPDLLAEYGEWLERAQDHDAWDADRRAELVLAGLGLASIPNDRTLAAISGGQRARLALGATNSTAPSTPAPARSSSPATTDGYDPDGTEPNSRSSPTTTRRANYGLPTSQRQDVGWRYPADVRGARSAELSPAQLRTR